MAPQSSNEDVNLAPASPNQTNDDLVDKIENGYAGMTDTPKVNSIVPVERKGLYRFTVNSVHLRECFAEFLGTFVMIVFGMGVNNQVTNSQDANGTWLSINMCWGIGVLIGVYCSEGISGANLNTAVTFAHCVYGRLPWWKAPGYMISQLLGAFIGAFVIYVMQYQNLNVIDPN
ncbi:hypothetical protein G195_011680, partial [Phytophthora kernoviae 00238/432]